MTSAAAMPPRRDRINRIAAQIDRLESNTSEWAVDPPGLGMVGLETVDDTGPIPPLGLAAQTGDSKVESSLLWEKGPDHAIVVDWRGILRKLAVDMKEKSIQPFSVRTRQISALCAFVPFVLSVLSAAIRYLPNMPSMALWSKVTWFIAFPIFLSMTGAFIGFLIGIMLDSIESQNRNQSHHRESDESSDDWRTVTEGPRSMKSAVWVAIEDLEPNQRVAETVMGEDGTPILLRHTLLKSTHIELLRRQNVRKVKVEVMKYANEGDLALAG
jgi:hypothetical protein